MRYGSTPDSLLSLEGGLSTAVANDKRHYGKKRTDQKHLLKGRCPAPLWNQRKHRQFSRCKEAYLSFSILSVLQGNEFPCPFVSQPNRSPSQHRKIDRKQDMAEKRSIHANVCSDGPPEIAGQQDRAQKSCTRNRVKNRGDESECTNHSKMMLGVSELQCSFHYGSWLNKLKILSKSINKMTSPLMIRAVHSRLFEMLFILSFLLSSFSTFGRFYDQASFPFEIPSLPLCSDFSHPPFPSNKDRASCIRK